MTDTLYVPAVSPVINWAVDPVFHRYLYGDVPPIPVNEAEPLDPPKQPTAVTAPSLVTQVSTGNITVASSPLGASIIIDGVYYGTTVGNLTGISTGNHMVRLTMSGYYDYEGTIYVVPGQVTHVFGTLPPLSGAAPQITQPLTPAPVTTTLPTITVLV